MEENGTTRKKGRVLVTIEIPQPPAAIFPALNTILNIFLHHLIFPREMGVAMLGRTVASYRTVLESLISDWQNFRKALRKEDRKAFDRLMDKTQGLPGYDPRLDPMESVFISILVEVEKENEELRGKVKEIEERNTLSSDS